MNFQELLGGLLQEKESATWHAILAQVESLSFCTPGMPAWAVAEIGAR